MSTITLGQDKMWRKRQAFCIWRQQETWVSVFRQKKNVRNETLGRSQLPDICL